jgi:hypothetical protein
MALRKIAPRAQLAGVLHFVSHHGDNEDTLLLPLLEGCAPDVVARMLGAHATIEASRGALASAIEAAACDDLYHQACAFTAA